MFCIGIGNLVSPKKPIYMGNSGTGVRLLLGLVAGSNALVTFYGDSSLSVRPMERLIKPLEQMGAKIVCSNNKLPITIIGARAKGFVLPITYKLPVPSAQLKSAILLAALSARGITSIIESKESRNSTEQMLKKRGAAIKKERVNKDKRIITIEGTSFLRSRNIKIPGDPSSAVFLAVAALITKKSQISIENVLYDSFRLRVFYVLKKMGANIKIIRSNENNCKIVAKSSKLKNIFLTEKLSVSLIDEYPILSIAAACAEGKMTMQGLRELRYKESDRFTAIIEGLKKSGVNANSDKDNIIIRGNKKIKGGFTLDAKYDHRIAMSFNILSLVTDKPIYIKGNESIYTSFPNFFNDLKALGALSRINE